jgi:hypothetical protein
LRVEVGGGLAVVRAVTGAGSAIERRRSGLTEIVGSELFGGGFENFGLRGGELGGLELCAPGWSIPGPT